jgi:hypothetical protein
MADREEISLLEEIQRLAVQDPFMPFAIVMASGGSYEVGEADDLAFGRNVISLFVRRGPMYLLRPNQISEVIVPQGAP